MLTPSESGTTSSFARPSSGDSGGMHKGVPPNAVESFSGGRQSMMDLIGQTGTASSLAGVTLEGTGGMFGSFQSLLHSFTSRVPQIHMGTQEIGLLPTHSYNIYPSATFEHIGDDATLDIGVTATTHGAESPARADVDESGYASSESSMYDVASDDENYMSEDPYIGVDQVDCAEQNFTGCDTSPVVNGHTCNSTEQMSTDVGGSGHAQHEHVKDCPCLSGNPFMHVMTDLAEGDSEENQWKKRNRSKSGEKRPDCRLPKGMGPIEIALRNAPHRKTKYIFEPVIGITFDSENEAYEFYNMYSWEVGFGIKRENLVKNGEGTKTKRDFRCLCAGTPDEAKYKSKKTGCKAMLRPGSLASFKHL